MNPLEDPRRTKFLRSFEDRQERQLAAYSFGRMTVRHDATSGMALAEAAFDPRLRLNPQHSFWKVVDRLFDTDPEVVVQYGDWLVSLRSWSQEDLKKLVGRKRRPRLQAPRPTPVGRCPVCLQRVPDLNSLEEKTDEFLVFESTASPHLRVVRPLTEEELIHE